MQTELARVVGQEPVGEYRVLSLDVPGVAAAARPGQFVHLRVPGLEMAVLRRPFSVYETEGDQLRILYKPVGLGTDAMAQLVPGGEVSIIGPLGNGFPTSLEGDAVPVLVAGGYGVAPLYYLASELPRRGSLFVGGRASRDILLTERFEQAGWEVHVATEDGTLGETGRVTTVLDAWLDARPDEAPPVTMFACGPDGMLRAVGERCIARNVTGWLSLDKHMGCGVGACLACVVRIKDEDGESWKRVCKDGPIFESREIVWP